MYIVQGTLATINVILMQSQYLLHIINSEVQVYVDKSNIFYGMSNADNINFRLTKNIFYSIYSATATTAYSLV